MHISSASAHLPHDLLPWAVEIGLSLLILGYLFRGVLDFAVWTLEFLWA